MMTLGLSDAGLSDGALSDGMVLKSERMDGVLPRGLVMLTIAVGIDNNEGDLGQRNLRRRDLWNNISLIKYCWVEAYRSQGG